MVVTEEGKSFSVYWFIPENTQKKTSNTAYSKLFINIPSKHLKDNEHNSLCFAWKYVQTFVLGHYLFLKAHSFLQALLLVNCLYLDTDNVHGQITIHNFFTKERLYLYIITVNLNISRMYNPTPNWKKLNVSDLRMNDHVLKQDHEQCTIKQPAPGCKTARCEKNTQIVEF